MAVLSVRVTDELKARISALVGKVVPKGTHGSGQILGDAIDRGLKSLEFDLLPESHPEQALANIWQRMQAGQAPTQPQWRMFAQLVHEAFLYTQRRFARRESVLALGEAFLDIFDLVDSGRPTGWDRGYFLGNVPNNHDHSDVRDAARAYLNQLPRFPPTGPNEFFSRNLEVIVRDETTQRDESALKRIFESRFDVLYPLAVHGLREKHRLSSQGSEHFGHALPSLAPDKPDNFISLPSQSANGVSVTPIFLEDRVGLICCLPEPTSLCISFDHPSELGGALDELFANGIGETRSYSFCATAHRNNQAGQIFFSRDFLRLELSYAVVETLLSLLDVAFSEARFEDSYRRWRVHAGDL